jgi:hypothetical protein
MEYYLPTEDLRLSYQEVKLMASSSVTDKPFLFNRLARFNLKLITSHKNEIERVTQPTNPNFQMT